jgi:hypothetical protein
VNKIAAADGFHLVQIHQVDFNDDGEIVLVLLVAHDRDSAALEVVRIQIKSGESGKVHKSSVGPPMAFIGVKDDQYVYLDFGRNLFLQSPESPEPVPLAAKRTE